MSNQKRTVWAWFGGIVAIGFMANVCAGNGAGSPSRDEAEAVGAWVVCQQFVEARLKAPSTAEYPGSYPDFTRALTDGTFRVDAYVDAQNSFGAMLRIPFSCTVSYRGNDNWHLESLTMDE